MNTLAKLAAAIAAAAAFSPAAARAEWYAGGAYAHYDLGGADVGGLTGRLGYTLNPNLAFEGEATLGVEDDANAELNSAIGAYAVGVLPLGQGFDVFGRVGYQHLDVDGAGAVANDGGLSYGAGANLRLSAGIGLRADYTRTETDGPDVDAISLGGVVNF